MVLYTLSNSSHLKIVRVGQHSHCCPLLYRNCGSETLRPRHEAHLPRKASSVADWAPTPKGMMSLHITPISASSYGYCVHDVHTRTHMKEKQAG